LLSNATGGQLAPVLSGSIIDISGSPSVDRTPDFTLTNTGLVTALRGNATLLGANVAQNGIVLASTSVTRPGRVVILAQDEGGDSGPARVGTVTFGSNSVTAILPDANGETTTSSAASDAAFQPGNASLIGGSVWFQSGALVDMPGSGVTVAAR